MRLSVSLVPTFLFCAISLTRTSAFNQCLSNPRAQPSRLLGSRKDDTDADAALAINMSSIRNDTRRGFFKDSFGLSVATATLAVSSQPKKANAFVEPQQSAGTTTTPTTTTLYNTAKDIPESVIDDHQRLFGYVEKVIDGDTVRIRHIPDVQAFLTTTSSNNGGKSKRPPLSNTTIVVRMYGVDAPETAKKQDEVSQPYGEDAKQLTKDLVYHKLVAVKLLRRDKYNRIVGEVETCVVKTSPTSSCTSTDVSVELVSRGLATLYTGGGAEYDGKKDLLKQRVEEAQKSKLGIWSLGDEMVTPAEFKRRKRLEEQ